MHVQTCNSYNLKEIPKICLWKIKFLEMWYPNNVIYWPHPPSTWGMHSPKFYICGEGYQWGESYLAVLTKWKLGIFHFPESKSGANDRVAPCDCEKERRNWETTILRCRSNPVALTLLWNENLAERVQKRENPNFLLIYYVFSKYWTPLNLSI